MRKIKILTVLALLLLPTLLIHTTTADEPLEAIRTSEQYQEGYRFNVQGWIYVHIQGDAYERGYQHGYLLAAEIVDMLNRWSTIIHNYPIIKSLSKRQSDERFEKMSMRWWEFCTSTCYRMYWDKFPEEYQQEIKGIAHGVAARGGKLFSRNVNYQDILAMNEMYEFLSKLTLIPKGIHPLRTLLQQLQQLVPELSRVNVSTLLETFLRQSPAHHCNGFIATGDATTEGQLVFSHSTICGGGMWWWTYYISLRWNVLLDIEPISGHRIIMPTSPGLIWSDEDYYQNDYGLVLLETTVPQGPYDNKGLPLSIRARNAMQYGDSIDDMSYALRFRNDGCMNAVWLLGDTKTGEIARLDLGYRHAAIWRTFNGFYWSANIPRDFRVRLERITIKDFLINFVLCNVFQSGGWGYYSIRYIPQKRDLLFEELGNKYYGSIDIETVKNIMCTSPISDWITDVKVTDSHLLAQNGLWAFFGNPHRPLLITNVDDQVVTTEEVPPAGWVRLFGLPLKEGYVLPTPERKIVEEEPTILWEFDTNEQTSSVTASYAVFNETLYVTRPSGTFSCVDAPTGMEHWQLTIGLNPTVPILHQGKLYVGDAEGVAQYSQSGLKHWKIQTEGAVVSPIVPIGNEVFVADSQGYVYCLATSDGHEQWRLQFSNESYLSQTYDENIYLASGDSVYAIQRADHRIVWTMPTQGRITSSPVLMDDTVYVASWDTRVYALQAANGNTKWTAETGWGVDTPPVISKGVVYVGGLDNNLYAFDTQGALQWVFPCHASIHSTPTVYGEYVFVGSDDGRLYAVNQSTGEPAWVFAPGFTIQGVKNYATTPIVNDPVVTEGTVIIAVNGTLYGLDAHTVETPQSLVHQHAETTSFDLLAHWILWVVIILVLLTTIGYVVLKKRR